MKCKNCGAEGDGNYCEHCGTPLTKDGFNAQKQLNQKTKIANTSVSPKQEINGIPINAGPSVTQQMYADKAADQATAEPAAVQPVVRPSGQTSDRQNENNNTVKTNSKTKTQKPIYKKWWFWGVAALVVIVAIAAVNGGKAGTGGNISAVSAASDKAVTSGKTAVSGKASEPPVAKAKVYKDGTYMVGKDIEAGLYKATLTDTLMKMGYIERAKAVTMSTDDILANIILTGNGYVEIKSTDKAVKLQGVSITKIDLASLKKNPQTQVSDGMYLVGYDIKPGTYKVEVTDQTTNMGYVERTANASMDTNDIIANEIIQSSGYVKIKDTDFAVRVQGVKLTLQS